MMLTWKMKMYILKVIQEDIMVRSSIEANTAALRLRRWIKRGNATLTLAVVSTLRSTKCN